MRLATALGWRARSRRSMGAASGGDVGVTPVFVSFGLTHVGRVRTINEDRVLDRPDVGLWAVIDGMGGHSCGDLAADTVFQALTALADRGAPDTAGVRAALLSANRILHAAGSEAQQVRGATVAVAVRSSDGFALLWAGDCRILLLREGTATRLTRDHSVVQDLIDAGHIAADEAHTHPRNNIVTRALGAGPTIEIETRRVALRAGDTVLLCSDGLDHPERSLATTTVTAPAPSPLSRASTLVDGALGRGGHDNVSVVVVDVT